ncbi:MAG TPA: DUF2063 domain-containing protein, partial [Verrucomicrobiae bacterium]|nr:DUF2063 domain-containing protein [Verrucomicrobiae bacterium]
SNAMEQRRHRAGVRTARGLKRRVNFLAVHRYQDGVYYKPLEPGQFILLSALQKGATLEAACARLVRLKLAGDLGATVRQWFANWAALGWFYGLKPSK